MKQKSSIHSVWLHGESDQSLFFLRWNVSSPSLVIYPSNCQRLLSKPLVNLCTKHPVSHLCLLLPQALHLFPPLLLHPSPSTLFKIRDLTVFLHLFHCWCTLKCQNRWQWLTSFNDLSRGLWKRHCVFWLKHMPFFNHLRIAARSLPKFSQADFQSTVLLFYCIIAKPAWSPDWVQKADWRGCWRSVIWFYAICHLWPTTPTASVSGANCIGFRGWYLRYCSRPIAYWF